MKKAIKILILLLSVSSYSQKDDGMILIEKKTVITYTKENIEELDSLSFEEKRNDTLFYSKPKPYVYYEVKEHIYTTYGWRTIKYTVLNKKQLRHVINKFKLDQKNKISKNNFITINKKYRKDFRRGKY